MRTRLVLVLDYASGLCGEEPTNCFATREGGGLAACACHSLGTVANGTCDARTGQCPCREGLTRRRCDICAPGYKQSDNAVEPCISTITL